MVEIRFPPFLPNCPANEVRQISPMQPCLRRSLSNLVTQREKELESFIF